MEGMAEFPNTFGSGKYPGNTISYVGRGVGGGGKADREKKKEKRKPGQGQMQDHRMCTEKLVCE